MEVSLMCTEVGALLFFEHKTVQTDRKLTMCWFASVYILT